MLKTILITAVLLFQTGLFAQFQYPETKKGDVVDDYHGTKVADPYRWLEDDHSEETKAWVTEQNKVTFGYLESIPFRDKIKERFTQIFNYPNMVRRSKPVTSITSLRMTACRTKV